MKDDKEIIAKYLLLSAALAIFLSLFVPYWKLRVIAPQYPKGLSVAIYLNRVEGDVREIDGLNHYIGMKPLAKAAQLERKLAIPGLILSSLGVFIATFYGKRGSFLLVLPALILPLFFALDLYWWLRDFGLHLVPKAALSSSIKPFVPPLIGHGKIAQFKAHASFSWGFLASLAADLFICFALWLRRSKEKCSEGTGKVSVAVLSLLAFGFLLSPQTLAATLEVGREAVYGTIQEALVHASDGDTIVVHEGVYAGPVVIDKSVTLTGNGMPVIHGGGRGTVVFAHAPHITLQGFKIRDSGDLLAEENSGVLVTGSDAAIEGNRFEDVLFGIYLRQAPRTLIRNNVLSGKVLPLPRRGDLIRVWYSDDVTIEGNRMHRGRDVVLWFSKSLNVNQNIVKEGRYGLHFMYCHDAVVEENLISGNSVGTYLMYSSDLRLRRNRVLDNRGPSGYGVGFKDMDGALLSDNLIANNRVGLFFDRSTGVFRKNLIAYNDIGIELLPSSGDNTFEENSFFENSEQVGLENLGSRAVTQWSQNFWSDYRGYDRDHNGIGDTPYQAVQFFERLTSEHPVLRLFFLSPSHQALDFASSLFPIFAPQPKLSDQTPLMSPTFPSLPREPQKISVSWVFVSGILLIPPFGLSFGSLRKKRYRVNAAETITEFETVKDGEPMIQIDGLTKRFGPLTALDRVRCVIQKGETVALWGPNGAGKTTLLKCLLGILSCRGTIRVAGRNVQLEGKAVRKIIGYIPQELRFHGDQSVVETVCFFARLRNVSDSQADTLIKEWGLAEAREKKIHELSGGMKQKLGLVIALISDPPVLLMDEPTSHLDVAARHEFLLLLERLKERGKTLVFCSHRVSEVLKLADRVVVLCSGVKTKEGKPDDVKEHLTGETVLCLTVRTEDCERAERLISEHGISVRRNTRQLWIRVGAGRKIEPIRLLSERGIPILDFELETDYESPAK